MEDNIAELETKLENNVTEEVQPVVKKSVGRPRKPVNENEPKKKEYYIKKNTKPTGRPITKTPEELKQNARRLEKEYNKRRGNLIVKVSYLIEKYETIPEELKTLPQTTQEELQNKYLKIYDYVTEIKKNKIINRTRNSNNTNNTNTTTNTNTNTI